MDSYETFSQVLFYCFWQEVISQGLWPNDLVVDSAVRSYYMSICLSEILVVVHEYPNLCHVKFSPSAFHFGMESLMATLFITSK